MKYLPENEMFSNQGLDRTATPDITIKHLTCKFLDILHINQQPLVLRGPCISCLYRIQNWFTKKSDALSGFNNNQKNFFLKNHILNIKITRSNYELTFKDA